MAIVKKQAGIRSVSDFAREIATLKGVERYLFRGQNTDKPLKPKIAREPNVSGREIVETEKRMLERFKKESPPFLNGTQPRTDWDWLSVAQHQGMSTRLLDWSANALAALWFSVSTDPPKGEKYGVVWALGIRSDDLKSPDEKEDVWSLKRTYVFQPFHMDRRISAQSGWFSVHKYLPDRSGFIALDKNVTYKNKLKKFTILREEFPTIRAELRRMGITRASLFPDLSGLSADIDEEFLKKQRDPEDI